MEAWSIDMFSQHICRILRPCHLLECKIPSSHFILHPQISHGEMSDLAKATAPANADGRRGICEYSEAEVEAQV